MKNFRLEVNSNRGYRYDEKRGILYYWRRGYSKQEIPVTPFIFNIKDVRPVAGNVVFNCQLIDTESELTISLADCLIPDVISEIHRTERINNPEHFRKAVTCVLNYLISETLKCERGGAMGEAEAPSGFDEFKTKHPDYFLNKSGKEYPLDKQFKVYQGFKNVQKRDREHKQENFQKLDRAVERKNRKEEDSPAPDSDDRKINITNYRLREMNELALVALQRENDPPRIFIRSGGLVRVIQDEKGTPSIQICDPDILKHILERAADFAKFRGDGSEKAISPPMELVKDILANTDWSGFPAIEGIVEAPVILTDGSVTASPGYYPALRMLYFPSPDLQLPDIPDKPGHKEITGAVNLLREIFVDFPFENEASRTNAIAALMTAVLRPVIPSFVPLALIDKPQQGAGASLMTDVIAMVATGRSAAKMTAPTDESEWRKTITARLSQGQGLFVIDNIDRRLVTSSLASVLTSETWNDRVLGQSATITLTNHAVFIANGINVETGADIARRVYWIRVDPKQARPDQRTDFIHPDLLQWVKHERGRILAAILTLTRAWIQAGSPAPAGIPQMGSFEKWRGMIGGIMGVAGVPGFLGNLEQFRERSDALTSQWDSFLQALKEQFPGSFTVKDVRACLEAYSDDRQSSFNDPTVRLCDVIPDDIPLKDKDPSRAIGKAFTKKADRVFPSGIVLRKEEKRIHQAVAWKIET
jgi:hypothetical protein